MIRYKVQCPGVVGHECRTGRKTAEPVRVIGTFLFRTATKAEACASGLRRLGYAPKLIKLWPHTGLPA